MHQPILFQELDITNEAALQELFSKVRVKSCSAPRWPHGLQGVRRVCAGGGSLEGDVDWAGAEQGGQC